MKLKSCYLVNAAKEDENIYLPDMQPVCLGRKKVFDIREPYISRSQIICTANVTKEEVTVKPVGLNISGCNGYALQKSKLYTLKAGDRIELVLGSHIYIVVFSDKESTLSENTIADVAVGESTDTEITKEEEEPKRKKMRVEVPAEEIKKWEYIDNSEVLIYTTGDCLSRSLIASFDIDGTIIKTKSGARFPKDMEDWIFNFPSIPHKLKDLCENEYKIVFFTNQLHLHRDKVKIKEFKTKIESIASKLLVPVQVFIATGRTIYRKPIPGMWNLLFATKNDGISINLSKSFFVGDAAGREKNWAPKKKKDHSNCDRLFALNVGIEFYTPEEYFLKAPKVKYLMPEFDPRNLSSASYPEFLCDEQEVVIMVGAQGSGKSHFCKQKLIPKGYVYINRDKLGSWQKCVKHLEDCLEQKKSAVVDNTNPDKESRLKYVNVAKRYNVKCRCFIMTTSPKHCKHNNKFRELVDKNHAVVSEIIINSYHKNFCPPDISEGFSEIVEIPFVPEVKDPEQEKLYKLFLLES